MFGPSLLRGRSGEWLYHFLPSITRLLWIQVLSDRVLTNRSGSRKTLGTGGIKPRILANPATDTRGSPLRITLYNCRTNQASIA